jgi:hypothetical protein
MWRVFGSMASWQPGFGKFFDRRADVQQDAGPQVLFGFLQLDFAFGQDIRIDGPAFGMHPRGFVIEPAGANVVATGDKFFPVGQFQRVKLRQLTDQAGPADQAFLQSRQPNQGRGGHAPFGARKPNSDTRAGHAESFPMDRANVVGRKPARLRGRWSSGGFVAAGHDSRAARCGAAVTAALGHGRPLGSEPLTYYDCRTH